ncbi:hypothetical protein AB0I54_05185 [Streptomyces sp. NPDC050625]|uniref:hypothetical protein n=1 Tax=Streptomyces sp. NPDC050625 TaxID=3154629 RepID=UPI00342CC2F4
MTRVAHGLDRVGSRLALVGRPRLGPGMRATVVDHHGEGQVPALTGHLVSAGRHRIAHLGPVRSCGSALACCGFVVGRPPLGLGMRATVVDHRGGGQAPALTGHLVSAGRHRIAHLGPVRSWDSALACCGFRWMMWSGLL